MRAHEQVIFASNAAAGTSAKFPIVGGKYMWAYVGTGSGTADLKVVGPDGSTLIAVATQITTNSGGQVLDLPPGSYAAVTSGFTANYASLTRIPEE